MKEVLIVWVLTLPGCGLTAYVMSKLSITIFQGEKNTVRKKQLDYFRELNQSAADTYRAARVLQEVVNNYSLENLVKKSEAIHQLEKKNDGIVRKTLNELYIFFTTPIDRGGIVDITGHLSNIIDSIDSSPCLLDHLVAEEVIVPVLELTIYIVKATEGVKSTTKEFTRFKNPKMLVSLIDEVNTIGSQGDKLYSSVMKDLVTNEKDLLEIIEWKDVYSQLGRMINNCESAANITVGIVIKNT